MHDQVAYNHETVAENDSNFESCPAVPLVVEIPLITSLPHNCPEAQPGVTLSKSNSSESGRSSSNLEVESDSSIWANRKGSKAVKIWKFAHQLGVSGKESEETYVTKIKEMEDRDKGVKRKKEATAVPK